MKAGQEPNDDRVIAWLLIIIGAIPVVTASLRGTKFGAEATLGLLMMVVGSTTKIREILPTARARQTNRDA